MLEAHKGPSCMHPSAELLSAISSALAQLSPLLHWLRKDSAAELASQGLAVCQQALKTVQELDSERTASQHQLCLELVRASHRSPSDPGLVCKTELAELEAERLARRGLQEELARVWSWLKCLFLALLVTLLCLAFLIRCLCARRTARDQAQPALPAAEAENFDNNVIESSTGVTRPSTRRQRQIQHG